MKHTTIIGNEDGSNLRTLVEDWIERNDDDILEVLDIEYINTGGLYLATITFEEKKDK